jgi:NADPH:quinone reductase-like Zn-dependent oxidoreductase
MLGMVFRTYGGPEVLESAELPDPTPARGEVRVRVRAVALNHLDIFVRRGIESLRIPLPHIGGSDVAGVVDALGPDVEGWSAGDEVIVNPSLPCGACPYCVQGESPLCLTFRILGEHVAGGLAELVVVPADRLHRKPAGMSWAEAASVPLAFQTAWRAVVTRAAVRPGERVVVLGASGGVATAAVQIARLAGAHVTAVTSSDEKCAALMALGADVAIDRTRESWSRTVWQSTGKLGADVIVENVGAATWPDSLRTCARGGRIVTYGATTGPLAETDLRYLFWRQITIMGTTMATDGEFRAVLGELAAGRLRPVVGLVMPLRDAARAHETLEAGGVLGKLVLTVP